MRCVFPECKNDAYKGYSMFEVSERRREKLQWLQILGLSQSTPKNARLCEGHFNRDQFETIDNYGTARLKSLARPSISTPNPPKVLEKVVLSQFDAVPGTSDVFLQTDKHSFKKLVGETPKRPGTAMQPKGILKNITNDGNFGKDSSPRSLLIKNQNVKLMQDRIQELEAKTKQLENNVSHLREHNQKLGVKVNTLEKSKENLTANIDKILTPEQLKLLELSNPSQNQQKWGVKSMKKALRVRLISGSRGYESLRQNEKWPLPSLRTVNRRLKNFELIPGHFESIIKNLSVKLNEEKLPSARLAVLALDEMSTEAKVEYDKGLHTYLGFISSEVARSEEDKTKIASKALAVVLRGLTVHWKQFITYVHTGESLDAGLLSNFIDKIILCLSKYEITVVVVSSDMGSANRGMWSMKGTLCNKGATRVTGTHPCPSKDAPHILYCPDVPHVLKNCWACLTTHNFVMPKEWLSKYNLLHHLVSANHVKELLDFQGQTGVRLVPKLLESALVPSHFQKMRVPVALAFFDEKVGKTLIFLSQQGKISKEAETTGVFILQMSRFWLLMSSRNRQKGLRCNERGVESIQFLKEFMVLFENIMFVNRSTNVFVKLQWKPIQVGVIMACHVVIHLWEKFVVTKKLDYLLTSRLFSSSCENLFSQVRGGGDMQPGPVHFRLVLRLISVAQMIRCSPTGNYIDDEEAYYLEFLSTKCLNRREDWVFDEQEVDSIVNMTPAQLSEMRGMGLYFIAGWVAFELKGLCSSCDDIIASPNPVLGLPSEFTSAVSRGHLTHPTNSVWLIVLFLEDIFNQKGKTLLSHQEVQKFLVLCAQKKFNHLFSLFTCHKIVDKVANKFLSLRLHILASDISSGIEIVKLFSSASAYMRTASRLHGKHPIQPKQYPGKRNAPTSGPTVPKKILTVGNEKNAARVAVIPQTGKQNAPTSGPTVPQKILNFGNEKNAASVPVIPQTGKRNAPTSGPTVTKKIMTVCEKKNTARVPVSPETKQSTEKEIEVTPQRPKAPRQYQRKKSSLMRSTNIT